MKHNVWKHNSNYFILEVSVTYLCTTKHLLMQHMYMVTYQTVLYYSRLVEL